MVDNATNPVGKLENNLKKLFNKKVKKDLIIDLTRK